MKRYPSCPRADSNCVECSSCSYGMDCHNIPIEQPPKLRNAAGYPMAFDSLRAMVSLGGDFTQREIDTLRAAIALQNARAKTRLTRAETARVLGIPLRTLEMWEYGLRLPPKFTLEAVLSRLAESEIDREAK